MTPAAAWREALEKAKARDWTAIENLGRKFVSETGEPTGVAEALVKWMEAEAERLRFLAWMEADSRNRNAEANLLIMERCDSAHTALYAALVAAAPKGEK